jgi:zinc transport system permease protein
MFGKGFKKTMFISCAISVFSVVFGIILSYYSNLAPSGTIVLTMISMFLVTIIAKNLRVRYNKITVAK